MTARLEVIVGPMFSGKTELLIAKLHRAQYAKKRIRIIKPAHDTRTQGFIASRAVNTDGTLTYTFVESVKATFPFYVLRLLGGTLYLSGMIIMLWNTLKTATSGRSVNVTIPAAAAHA